MSWQMKVDNLRCLSLWSSLHFLVCLSRERKCSTWILKHFFIQSLFISSSIALTFKKMQHVCLNEKKCCLFENKWYAYLIANPLYARSFLCPFNALLPWCPLTSIISSHSSNDLLSLTCTALTPTQTHSASAIAEEGFNTAPRCWMAFQWLQKIKMPLDSYSWLFGRI